MSKFLLIQTFFLIFVKIIIMKINETKQLQYRRYNAFGTKIISLVVSESPLL
jgi:hypothetical protein